MTTWVIGNWKQHPKTLHEASVLAKTIANNIPAVSPYVQRTLTCQVVIAPSYLHLDSLSHALKRTDVTLAAQDVDSKSIDTGAYTGDISAQQLVDIGAKWVIIAHSERRRFYNETNEVIHQKIQHAIDAGLGVIFCIGEDEAQYRTQQTLTVLKEQISALNEIQGLNQHNLLIAYEPVWAIGTGLTPSIEEISTNHTYIKNELTEKLDDCFAVLYGGSVNPENAKILANCPAVDGVLVGGASLQANSFNSIINTFTERQVDQSIV